MNSAERESAILGLEPKVRILASAHWRRLHSVGFDEILSAAWVGAIQAVDNYDPARGALGTYADWKIRGAIGDYLRSLDPLTRDHRRAVQEGTQAAPRHQRLEFEAKHGVMPLSLPDTRAGRERAALEARLDTERLFRRAQLRAKDITILAATMHGVLMKEVGRTLGISEGRVSQIRARALEKLRAAA